MNSDRKTELLVGLFLLGGLALTASVVMQFGKVRDYFRGTYTKLVQFDDATGIRLGSPVALGGQKVGKVKVEPLLNAPLYNTVTLELEIYETYQIPENVRYEIATSGLLGDAYIAIRPAMSAPKVVTREDGKVVVMGTKAAGLDTLTSAATDISGDVKKMIGDVDLTALELKDALKRVNEGALSEPTLADFRKSMNHLQVAMKKVDEQVLHPENSEGLKKAIKDMQEASAALKRGAEALEVTSKKLSPLVDKVGPVLNQLTKASHTLDSTLKSFQKGADHFSELTRTMAKGEGLFRALLTDSELRDDFKSLIDNMRRNGLVFYRDNAEKVRAAEEAKRRKDWDN
jgi:phospholipid/cholesterol/gamma-HCH transport system substrate-binding protein